METRPKTQASKTLHHSLFDLAKRNSAKYDLNVRFAQAEPDPDGEAARAKLRAHALARAGLGADRGLQPLADFLVSVALKDR